jgi:hypothetical protein
MPQCAHTATKRITIMPEPGIVLNSDQIGDLHELLDHAETIAQWLLHATDEIIDDLAQTAYAAHFHPRSAVFWLVEDLVHTQYRLQSPPPRHQQPRPGPRPRHSRRARRTGRDKRNDLLPRQA